MIGYGIPATFLPDPESGRFGAPNACPQGKLSAT
ncbi:MAG: hypothetical protein JWL97_4180 [Gemmatimonadales bacterium]|jgi:hypothetical protein|nr:hypothetical protein [Gemmatimonadales bacterium]